MNRYNLRLWTVVICLLGSICPSAFSQSLFFNTQDFPPFSYSIENKVAGPAVQIIDAACAKSGLTCTFRLLPWIRAQKEVEAGSAHALFLIGKNTQRETWLTFSPPILETEYGFFVRSDNNLTYEELEDIRGYRIGVYGPSNTSKKLNRLRAKTKDSFTIDIRPDDESGFKKLSVGRINAVFSNKDSGFALIYKMKLENIRYAGMQCTLNYYIGFSKAHTDPGVVTRFNTALAALIQDGTVRRILGFYFLTPAEAGQDR